MQDVMAASPEVAIEAAGARSRVWQSVWIPLGLALVGCVYATLLCSSGPDVSGHAIGADDSYITYRYAQNWVAGHGPVFNPGERVEGYSNPLFVALMTLPFLLHLDAFYFSVVLGGLCVLTTLLLLHRHLLARFDASAAQLGTLLVALSPSIWLWVSSGMETPLILLLQVAVWLLVERVCEKPEPRATFLLGFVVFVLVLARADGFITGGIAASFLLLTGRRRTGATVLGVTFATLAALISIRLWYYGDIWPNTYYAKVTATVPQRVVAAIKQLGGTTARHGILPYLVAFGFGLLAVAKTLRPNLARGLQALPFSVYFLSAWLCYWLYVGGDNFEDRFLLIVIPMGVSLLVELVRSSPIGTQRVVFAFALATQLAPIARDDRFGKHLVAKYDYRIKLGEYMAQHYAHKTLATTAAGKIPYFSGLPTIDMLGLTDRHIGHSVATAFNVGHSKYDAEYVLSRKPDLIAATLYDDALALDPRFSAELYKKAGYRIHLLVNVLAESQGNQDILDATGRSDKDIALLAHHGWRVALLERDAGSTL